jgi:hypothetical protein
MMMRRGTNSPAFHDVTSTPGSAATNHSAACRGGRGGGEEVGKGGGEGARSTHTQHTPSTHHLARPRTTAAAVATKAMTTTLVSKYDVTMPTRKACLRGVSGQPDRRVVYRRVRTAEVRWRPDHTSAMGKEGGQAGWMEARWGELLAGAGKIGAQTWGRWVEPTRARWGTPGRPGRASGGEARRAGRQARGAHLGLHRAAAHSPQAARPPPPPFAHNGWTSATTPGRHRPPSPTRA